MNIPFDAVWDGHGFNPLPRFHNVIAAEFGVGEVVTLIQNEGSSTRSRNHYFATLGDIFDSLPDHIRWPTLDHFRKHGLIATGYRDERSIVCASKAEAQRLAAFIKPMDEYAIVVPSEAVVTVYTAKSQKRAAMGKETFQRSKDDVLAWAADQIGVTLDEVRGQGSGGANNPARVAA